MTKISIIVVNWNTKDLLRDCLNSVIAQTKTDYELFVVDNDSPDKSADMVKAEFPKVKLIANKENRGFAAANNQAIEIASGEYIFLLNPDTIILENAIDKMVDYMDRNPQIGASSCKLLNGDGSLQKSVGNFYSFWATILENRIIPKLLPNSKFLSKRLVAFWDHETEREIDWARGAVLLVRNSIVKEIGALDEQYYIYGEEIDWCWRIKKAGYNIMYLPQAEIIHFGKASSEQRKIAMFIQNYKSFYIFLKKNYPFYSYYIYRSRTMVYIYLWLLKFKVSKILNRNDSAKESALQGMEVYKASLKWHWSKESKIHVYKG